MRVVPMVFLVLALCASVVIGVQMRQWSWGPCLVFLALSLIFAAVHFRKAEYSPKGWTVLVSLLLAAWFAGRAFFSPVAEFGISDGLLLFIAAGGGLVASRLKGDLPSQSVFLWGLTALTFASTVVVAIQMKDPTFSFPYSSRPQPLPSGFFGHYNDGANFLAAAAVILASGALFARAGYLSRTVWFLVATGAAVAVYFTRSRGGILALCVALGVLLVLSIVSTRKSSKWFGPVLLTLPFAVIAVLGLLWLGWEDAQQLRFGSGAEEVVDNPIRLIILDLAVSCVNEAPWIGGGSQSFAWNCYKHWDLQAHGRVPARIEMAHNELMQAATDYGLIGAGLVMILLVTVTVSAVVALFVRNGEDDRTGVRWLAIGGTSALAAMFVQSCFSFVFHISPGALPLGLALGMMAAAASGKRSGGSFSAWAAHVSVVCVCLLAGGLLLAGINRTRAAIHVAPVFMRDMPYTESADRMGRGIRTLPLASMYYERAFLLQKAAENDTPDSDEQRAEAVADYAMAAKGYPFHIATSVNRSKLLAYLGRDEEAEVAFADTIRNQYVGESLFLGHFRRAEYYLERGSRELANGDAVAALTSFERGVNDIEAVRALDLDVIAPYPSRKKVDSELNENLAIALEKAGDLEGAVRYYEIASKRYEQSAAAYRAAVLMGRIASSAWEERRPEEALRWFLDARDLAATASLLPPNVTAEERNALLAYLDEMITFMKDARITPKEKR